jgi:hypothetical protein
MNIINRHHLKFWLVTAQQEVQGDAVPLPERAGCMCPRKFPFSLACRRRRHKRGT